MNYLFNDMFPQLTISISLVAQFLFIMALLAIIARRYRKRQILGMVYKVCYKLSNESLEDYYPALEVIAQMQQFSLIKAGKLEHIRCMDTHYLKTLIVIMKGNDPSTDPNVLFNYCHAIDKLYLGNDPNVKGQSRATVRTIDFLNVFRQGLYDGMRERKYPIDKRML